MFFQLIGYGPDLDPSTPGVLVDCYNILPREDGFEPVQTFTEVGITSGITGGYVRSMACARVGDYLHTVISVHGANNLGSTSSTLTLHEILSDGSTTIRATCTAVPYFQPVMFDQFNGEMFAARANQPLRVATYNGDFTAVTGAPELSIVKATTNFLVGFRTSDDYDWYCSAIGDAHDWTLSVSNQCARGKFWNRSGFLTAAARLNDNLLAFTDTQTWVGRYVGAPDVWQWEQISRDIGCVGPEAVAETPYGVVWMGRNNLYIYDGATILPMKTEPIRSTIFEVGERDSIKYSALAWDRKKALLWVMRNTNFNQGYRHVAYVYHFGANKWGRVDGKVLMAANQLSQPDYRFTGMSVSVDDLLIVTGLTTATRLHRTSNTAQTGTGYLVTGYVGDQQTASMCRSVRPRFSAKATATNTATLETRLKELSGGATASQTATLDADYKFPFRQTGRWHSVKITLSDSDILNGIDIDVTPVGQR